MPLLSHNLGAMPRGFVGPSLGICAFIMFACNDELVEEVTKDVCYSEHRWIGGKRGSPEMYPGRDCVGCHLDNDGPPLAIGGTLYAYVLSSPDVLAAQSGEDCFGEPGRLITITDAEGQVFELTTNRAGNFYVEGNPDDFAKPFNAEIRDWVNGEGQLSTNPMATAPMYGGCARCHDPNVPLAGSPESEYEYTVDPPDAEYRNGTARIGLPGNRPGADGFENVVDELRSFIDAP